MSPQNSWRQEFVNYFQRLGFWTGKCLRDGMSAPTWFSIKRKWIHKFQENIISYFCRLQPKSMHSCGCQYNKFRKVELHSSSVFGILTACLFKHLVLVTLLLTMCHYWFFGGGEFPHYCHSSTSGTFLTSEGQDRRTGCICLTVARGDFVRLHCMLMLVTKIHLIPVFSGPSIRLS